MEQNVLKQRAALAALDELVQGSVVGVGSGSTVDLFIDALATQRDRFVGAVSSSRRSTRTRDQMVECVDGDSGYRTLAGRSRGSVGSDQSRSARCLALALDRLDDLWFGGQSGAAASALDPGTSSTFCTLQTVGCSPDLTRIKELLPGLRIAAETFG